MHFNLFKPLLSARQAKHKSEQKLPNISLEKKMLQPFAGKKEPGTKEKEKGPALKVFYVKKVEE